MALTTTQIQTLLNEARNAGLDETEVTALEYALTDRAADLSGADRIDIAFALGDPDDLRAAETFVQDSAQLRRDAMQRGRAVLREMSEDEWQRLTASSND